MRTNVWAKFSSSHYVGLRHIHTPVLIQPPMPSLTPEMPPNGLHVTPQPDP